MCGTTKFIGLVNAGKKYYCNSCMKKINDLEMVYWKPCSMDECFENFLSTRKNRVSFKEQMRQIREEEKENHDG